MKSIKTVMVSGLACVAVAMSPSVLATNASAPPVVLADEAEETEMIMGTVKEANENEIVLKDHVDETKETKVKLDDNTKYVKDGKPAKAADVTVGSRVTVKAKRDFLRRFEAVEVTILPPQKEPAPAL
jgi:hypothetical protein